MEPLSQAKLIGSKCVIVKVTSRCNLRCDYCYYCPQDDGEHSAVMSLALLKRLIDQALTTLEEPVEFNWHGGEPLLAGRGFYEEALALQCNHGPWRRNAVRNSIQTNGLLLDADWVAFCRKNDISIGMSLDGPQPLHDLYRVNPRGKGSYNGAVRALEIARAQGVTPGGLFVVTDASSQHPDAIFDFALEQRLNGFDFIPCIVCNRDTGHLLPPSVSPEAYGQFLVRVFDRWIGLDDPSIRIRFLENLLLRLMGGQASICELEGTCGLFITVDYRGDVYPCDRLTLDGRYRLGNLWEETLTSMLRSERYLGLLSKLNETPPECQGCRWLDICRGGCTYHRHFLHYSWSERNYFCEGRKMLLEHMQAYVDRVLGRVPSERQGLQGLRRP